MKTSSNGLEVLLMRRVVFSYKSLITGLNLYSLFVYTKTKHLWLNILLRTQRLGVGNISIRDKSVNYTLSSKSDLLKILSIFDIRPLNTTKNFNYILFRQGYYLYFKRESFKVTMELRKVIINLKDQMNKKRIDLNQPLTS